MPVNVSTGETLADIHISNPPRALSRQDASRTIEVGTAAAVFLHSRNVFTSMAANSSQTNLQIEGDRAQRSTDQAAPLTTTGRQNSDGLLQIPPETVGPRPVAPVVWDWNTDLNLVDESDNYHYEPQGELLRADQREDIQPSDEFSIPHAVAGPALRWNVEGPTEDEEGFVVPQRPSTIPQALAGIKRKSTSDTPGGSKQPESKRASRTMSETDSTSPQAETASTSSTLSQAGLSGRLRSQTDTAETRARPEFARLGDERPGHGPAGLRRTLTDPSMPMVLPARKVFPIQIGDKLFRLSGASISSDGKSILRHSALRMLADIRRAPSYFSQFFEEQLRLNEGAGSVRTLYIDRDPATFEDISLHLQGYHIQPRDGPHFVKLFADAQFFSCKYRDFCVVRRVANDF